MGVDESTPEGRSLAFQRRVASSNIRLEVKKVRARRAAGEQVEQLSARDQRVLGDRALLVALANVASKSASFLTSASKVGEAVAVAEGRRARPAHRPSPPERVAFREAGLYVERGKGRRALATLLLDSGRALDRADSTGHQRATVAMAIASRATVAYFPSGSPAPGERERVRQLPLTETLGLETLVVARDARGALTAAELRNLRRAIDRLVSAVGDT